VSGTVLATAAHIRDPRRGPGVAKSGKGKSKGGGTGPVCAGCKNFKPGADGTGRCTRKDKKRREDDKACGDYKKR